MLQGRTKSVSDGAALSSLDSVSRCDASGSAASQTGSSCVGGGDLHPAEEEGWVWSVTPEGNKADGSSSSVKHRKSSNL